MRKFLAAAGMLLILVALVTGLSLWTGAGPLAALLGATPGDGARPQGPAWKTVAAPNPSPDYNDLRAVAAASPSEIWAVGTYGTEQYALTLIERWDGAAWIHVPSPSIPSYSNHLYG